jgi:CspA family cold shock protein
LIRHSAGNPQRQKEHRLAQGTIARVTDRGFGFIQQEHGEDLFFHSSALQNVTFDEIRRGDVVEYTTEADTRGRGTRAVNVRKIDRTSQPE